MEIRKIMEKESAMKVLDDIKNKICDVDLDKICGEDVEIASGADKIVYSSLIQAVMCGLVYWDEENSCLCQNLIKEIKTGEISRTSLFYKHKLTLGDTKDFKSQNQIEHVIKSLSLITACPTHLIEKLTGTDLNIAIGCLSFFDK